MPADEHPNRSYYNKILCIREVHMMMQAENNHVGKRRRKSRAVYFLILLGCLTLLVLMMYMGMMIYTWIIEDKETIAPAVVEEVTEPVYTQAQLDELLAEARESAGEQAAQTKEEELLNAIRTSLTDGTTTVETLRPLYKDELVIVSGGRFHFIPIREDLKHNTYAEENLQILESGEYQYLEDGQVISHKGIDVSKHQGKINWQQVAADGVEFAFIRVALRGYGTGKLVEDEYFQQNIKGATAAGIKVGVYIFSQAINEEELLEEANFVLEKIAPYKVECPVVYDVEKVSSADGRMNALSVEERTRLTLLFCQTIENAGYKPMIYHNMEMGAMLLDLAQLENYDKWFAYYNQDMYYPYEYKVLQYSEKGSVNGISTAVDLNISFEPLWEE